MLAIYMMLLGLLGTMLYLRGVEEQEGELPSLHFIAAPLVFIAMVFVTLPISFAMWVAGHPR